MQCPFCSDERDIPVEGRIVEHLVVIQTDDGHIHVHGPLRNGEVIKRLLDAIDTERINTLVAQREEARQEGNYARADEIRDQLADQGIILEDTPTGTLWRYR